jgi:hypothetical protein
MRSHFRALAHVQATFVSVTALPPRKGAPPSMRLYAPRDDALTGKLKPPRVAKCGA